MRHSSRSPFFGHLAIAVMAAAGIVACGGNFTPTPQEGAGGGLGAGGADPGGKHDGGLAADATVLVDANDARCPPTAPLAYSPCPSDQLICDYQDGQGCSRRFTCITQSSMFAGTVATGVGVGPGGSPGWTTMVVWIAQSPMPGDACQTPGKICVYPESFPSRLVCTEAGTWEATSSTTTSMSTSITTVSTTTTNSTAFTAGTGVGGNSGFAGSGGHIGGSSGYGGLGNGGHDAGPD